MTLENGPEKILGMAQGFMESRIMLSAAELNLFTLLSKAPLTAKEINDKIKGDLKALTTLLDAVAAIGLLQKKDDAYFCAPDAAKYLTDDSSSTVLPMVLHAASLWTRWARLTSLAEGIPLPTLNLDFSRNEKELEAFIGAMHSIGEPMARRIAADVNPGCARSLLDVGGGSGTYTIAFLRAVPELKATIFDMPQVIEMARTRLDNAGLLDRVQLVGGNFHRDELPGGHDLALLSAIIHSNSPEQNLDLYQKIFRALVPGGRLLIRDHVMDPDRVSPRNGAIFAINMLVGTPGGGTYTYDEIASDLAAAGFVNIHILLEGEQMDAVVEAFKPSGNQK
jgi:SAM-dependent methyltransferase